MAEETKAQAAAREAAEAKAAEEAQAAADAAAKAKEQDALKADAVAAAKAELEAEYQAKVAEEVERLKREAAFGDSGDSDGRSFISRDVNGKLVTSGPSDGSMVEADE